MARPLVWSALLCAFLTLVAGCTRSPAAPPDALISATDGGGFKSLHDLFPGPPDLPCGCQPGLVWTISSCVPTTELHTCAKPCKDSADCAKGRGCDHRAASKACNHATQASACVPGPAMGFAPGALRITPTVGTAGKETEIIVFGGDFYIGALHWIVAVGDHQPKLVSQTNRCELRFKFTPPKPGVYAVTVGYGSKGQALAGFFTASGGVPAPKWIQPGYPCAGSQTCAQNPPHTCSCVKGRCACNKK
jgi:hypothetical protein